MKKLILAVLAAGGVRLFAADAPAPLVDVRAVLGLAAEVTKDRYPDADVVWVSDRVELSYEADGSWSFRNEEWVKPLTEKGVRELGDFSVHYSARYGEASIDDISFLGEDGALVPVPFRDTLKVATDNSSMHANITDPMDKRISCSVPGVKVGTVVRRLRTEREFKSRLGRNWAISLPLEYSAPIKESLVTLSAPLELPLARHELRNAVSNTVEATAAAVRDGRLQYRWYARNVPQTFREPLMPQGGEAVQSLHLSTFADWPAASKWYWDLSAPHLARTNATMVAKVAELTDGCRGDAERIAAVFKFVSQKVRYMGLTMESEAPGYEPHDIDITFGNLYGVCRDKAALLVALLRLAGYEAYPTLIHVGGAKDDEVPVPYFNHAIVAVARASVKGDLAPLGQRMDAKYLLMDPTNEMTKDLLPAYLADRSYLVARPDGEGIRRAAIATADENAVAVETEVELEPGGSAYVSYAATLDGIVANRYREWFAHLPPKWRRSQFENVLAREAPEIFKGASLVSARFEPADLTDTSKPMQVFARFRFDSLVRRGADADEFLPPFLTDALNPLDTLSFAFYLEKRRFPLQFTSTMARRERMTVRFADALGEPVSLPAKADVRCGDWSFVRSAEAKDGTLSLVRDERLANIRFPVAVYGDLRAKRAAAEVANRAACRFEKVDAQAANSRKVLKRYVAWVRGPCDWVTTNEEVTVIRKIGAKAGAAELKLPYNPPCRELELVAATSYGPDGAPHPITGKEINVMDSNAAGSAPRYGNGKLLVANIPSVDVGSTVSTVVARVVRDASAPYFSYNIFAVSEPADEMVHEIHFAPGLKPNVRLVNNESGAVEVEDTVGPDGWRHLRWSRRALAARPDEWQSPSWEFDSPTVYASLVDWEAYGRQIADEMEAAVDRDGDGRARALARELADGIDDPAGQIAAVMRHLYTNVRRVMPDAEWRMPRGTRYFGPDRSLADGYASPSDRALLLKSMLDELGFDCEIRLFSYGQDPKMFARERETGFFHAFQQPMLHAERRTAVWPFGRVETFDLSMLASGYDEPRASMFGNRHWFAPATGAFGRFPEVEGLYGNREVERTVVDLAENGDAAFEVEELTYGEHLGRFRKEWSETTPEWIRRKHAFLSRQLAGDAQPVGTLAFDAKSCPAKLAYRAKAAGFATVDGGRMTLSMNDTERGLRLLPAVGAGHRTLPISLPARDEEVGEVVVRFPKGYTEVDRLPEPFELKSPGGATWAKLVVGKTVADERLEVTLRLTTRRADTEVLDATYADWVRRWSERLANAFRGISARRPGL